MEYKQIQELIKAINKSNISELHIEEESGFKITIKQAQPTISEAQVVTLQAAPVAQYAPLPQAAPAAAPASPAAPAAPAADKTPAVDDKLITIKSPMIGTFYRSPSPDKPAFVNVGDEIRQGQVLCIVEAMKLFNEIESEVSGKIVKVLVDDASPVEYDQPLFLVEP
jgi:acetyl-CoA carboxylase biotin carboxyl carrier protein